MFGIFKSKAEREQEKLDKEIAKTERFLSDDKKMSDINKKRRELDKKKARRDDSNFRDKVFETNVKLNKLEEKFVMKIVSESNAVKYEREHNQSSKKSERRLKNAYLSLVMVKHAKKRLIEIENERDWNLALYSSSALDPKRMLLWTDIMTSPAVHMGVSTYTSHASEMSFIKAKLPIPTANSTAVQVIIRNSFRFFVSLSIIGDHMMQNTEFTIHSLATHLEPISAPKYPEY